MSARVSLRIHYERRSHLVLLLTLALLTATFLGYLLWAQGEAAAFGVQAPLTTSAPMRQYYLTDTPTGFTGADADTACAAGYHMASLYEILDTSNLKYNTDLGQTREDSGEGPPGGVPVIGWVRTGNHSWTDPVPGKGNCNAWDSSSSEDSGSFAALPNEWDTGQDIHVWNVDTQPCSSELPVWCVEDYLVPKMVYLPLAMKNY